MDGDIRIPSPQDDIDLENIIGQNETIDLDLDLNLLDIDEDPFLQAENFEEKFDLPAGRIDATPTKPRPNSLNLQSPFAIKLSKIMGSSTGNGDQQSTGSTDNEDVFWGSETSPKSVFDGDARSDTSIAESLSSLGSAGRNTNSRMPPPNAITKHPIRNNTPSESTGMLRKPMHSTRTPNGPPVSSRRSLGEIPSSQASINSRRPIRSTSVSATTRPPVPTGQQVLSSETTFIRPHSPSVMGAARPSTPTQIPRPSTPSKLPVYRQPFNDIPPTSNGKNVLSGTSTFAGSPFSKLHKANTGIINPIGNVGATQPAPTGRSLQAAPSTPKSKISTAQAPAAAAKMSGIPSPSRYGYSASGREVRSGSRLGSRLGKEGF
ncbi:uncharacterized protein VTP21DRAFT_10521 [Calcarisporiella thermophila]|uniref:uncharacterized protein n=1 Tax=Calcarisporiella thermophila TaxID=911321 RepID=UPI0037442ACD